METEDKIRAQMEDTRSSLTEKLETLEDKVASTVQGATADVANTVGAVTATVQGTLQAVKTTVADGVGAIKDFFDLPAHVERYPWAMVGGSVAVGFVTGMLLTPARQKARPASPTTPRRPEAAYQAQDGARSESWFQKFAPEISKLKNLALGAFLDTLRENILRAAPPNIGPQLGEFLSGVREKVTGAPARAPTGPELEVATTTGAFADR